MPLPLPNLRRPATLVAPSAYETAGGPGALRIEVWDKDPMPPTKKEQGPDAEDGRGLFLVEMLSERWGVYSPRGGGKAVWCDVGIVQADKTEELKPLEMLPLSKREQQGVSATNTHHRNMMDVATLERVLWGLRQLYA
jgi:hypothetical protein